MIIKKKISVLAASCKYLQTLPLIAVIFAGNVQSTLSNSIKFETNEVSQKNDEVYTHVEIMPEFRGGDDALMKYVRANMKYPATAIEKKVGGRVVARFIVGKDGKVSDVKIIKSLDPSCDDEVVKMIMGMPKWIPGKQGSKKLAVYTTLPIFYELTDNTVSVDVTPPVSDSTETIGSVTIRE